MRHFSRRLFAAIFLSFFISLFVHAQGMGAYFWGDADGNGDIGTPDVSSLTAILNNPAASDTVYYTKYPVSRYRQDTDGNGDIGAPDAAILRAWLYGDFSTISGGAASLVLETTTATVASGSSVLIGAHALSGSGSLALRTGFGVEFAIDATSPCQTAVIYGYTVKGGDTTSGYGWYHQAYKYTSQPFTPDFAIAKVLVRPTACSAGQHIYVRVFIPSDAHAVIPGQRFPNDLNAPQLLDIIVTSTDTTPPITTINTFPANPTNQTGATFSFTCADESLPCTFQCQIDGGGFSSCLSPVHYTSLATGSHIFSVYATDAVGNIEAAGTVYVSNSNGTDISIPDNDGWVYSSINISSALPANAVVTSVDVHYEIIHTYVGDLVVQLQDVSGGHSYTLWNRSGGSQHNINQTVTNITAFNTDLVNQEWRLYAEDQAAVDVGYIDYWWVNIYYNGSPSYTWTIDTTPPVTTITAYPPNPTSQTGATFSFTCADASQPCTFQCQMDSGGYSSCTSPKHYTGLSSASHTFYVKATDNAGNNESPGPSYTWAICKTIASIAIAPSSATIPELGTVQINATVTFSDGSTLACNTSCCGTTTSWWASGNLTVNTSGLVTASDVPKCAAPGSGTIIAINNGHTSNVSNITITNNNTVSGMTLSPASATIAELASVQINATATISDGSTLACNTGCCGTTSTWWASGNVTVNTSGLVTGSHVPGCAGGSGTTIAINNGHTSNVSNITVNNDETVTSVVIAPSSATIAELATVQINATATISDGSSALACNTSCCGTTTTWTPTGNITVNASGLVTASVIPNCAGGSGTVTAANNGHTSNVSNITVINNSTVSSVTISPASATIAELASVQINATAHLSDGSSTLCNTSCCGTATTWTPTGNVTVGASGLVTGTHVPGCAGGSGTVTAANNGHTSNVSTITVNNDETVSSVTIAPATATIAELASVQIYATATISDGSSTLCNTSCCGTTTTWTPTGNCTAVGGLVTGSSIPKCAGGSCTVTATNNTHVSNVSTITVNNDETVSSVAIAPTSATIAELATVQINATATLSDGSTNACNTGCCGTITTWTPTGNVTVSVTGLVTGTHVPGCAGGSGTVTAANNGHTSNVSTITVNNDEMVASMVIAPSSATIAELATVQINATASLSDGTTAGCNSSCCGTTTTWTPTGNVSVNSSGLVTGNSIPKCVGGSGTVTATNNGHTSTASTITVNNDETVSSVTIAPVIATIAELATVQINATATLNDGSTNACNTACCGTVTSWASAGSVTVNASGLVTANSIPKCVGGSGTVTATNNGHTSNVSTITVNNDETVASVTLAPASATIAELATVQINATATLSDGSTNVCNTSCCGTATTWTPTGNCTVSASGLVTGSSIPKCAGGSCTVTATNNTHVSNVSTITVNNDETVSNVTIAPATATIAELASVQINATATLNDGSTNACNTGCCGTVTSWASAGSVTVNASGLVTANSIPKCVGGSGTVTAANNGHTSNVSTITVNNDETVASVTLAPASATIAELGTVQLTATANLSDGSTNVCNTNCCGTTTTWTPTGNITVNTSGLVTGNHILKCAGGSGTITATNNGHISNVSTITVTNTHTVSSMTIAPASATIAELASVQINATATISDSSTVACNTNCCGTTTTWTPTGNITVSASGLITANSIPGCAGGSGTVTAANNGHTSTASTITVTNDEMVASMSIAPATATIAELGTVQINATASLSDGSTNACNTNCCGTTTTWTPTGNITVSASGLVTGSHVPGCAGGSGTLTASNNGHSSNISNITVNNDDTLSGIVVMPNPGNVNVGGTLQMHAMGNVSDGSTADCTTACCDTTTTWASGNTSIFTVSVSGLVSGVASGTAICTATNNTHPGNSTITVQGNWLPTKVALAAPYDGSAIWTGSEMIVWDGVYGAKYNPLTDSWKAVSTLNAPSGSGGYVGKLPAIWTGAVMITWGGGTNTGGKYNPATDSWIPTSLINAPSARSGHTGVWTGTEMIVWGGYDTSYTNTGGRYNPSSDTWTPTSMGANVPSPRQWHSAVWTNTEMIIWSGCDISCFLSFPNDGGKYNPATDAWTTIDTFTAPCGRVFHTAVWAGDRMIIYGGNCGYGPEDTGGEYYPAFDFWFPTPASGGTPREYVPGIWTGSKMLVFGGEGGQSLGSPVREYDPNAYSWSSYPINVSARQWQSAVWTGSSMLVWGGQVLHGYTISDPVDGGGIYYPSGAGLSHPINSSSSTPRGRYAPTSIWTGSEMIVWGGWDVVSLNTGGRYNPATDSWVLTSMGSNVPSPRLGHTAIWSGTEMIIWGGVDGSTRYNNGGRYNPATDSWTPTSTGANLPAARSGHTAIWTNSQMIIWGGGTGSSDYNSGGQYNPSTDSWTPTSTGANVPAVRSGHTAIWTNSQMIIWGGGSGGLDYNTGGRYNPTTDSWTPTSIGANVPSARDTHTAVWTGSEMIVWGGNDGSPFANTGGKYNPSTNTWIPTSTGTNVPAARYWHTSVWTGNEMIIWGGMDSSHYYNTGGQYNPSTNSWVPTSTDINVPLARNGHTAVWTGAQMIIWGGGGGGSAYALGGRYFP